MMFGYDLYSRSPKCPLKWGKNDDDPPAFGLPILKETQMGIESSYSHNSHNSHIQTCVAFSGITFWPIPNS